MIKNTNDGSKKAPSLRIDINYGTCEDLPSFSIGPKGNDRISTKMECRKL